MLTSISPLYYWTLDVRRVVCWIDKSDSAEGAPSGNFLHLHVGVLFALLIQGFLSAAFPLTHLDKGNPALFSIVEEYLQPHDYIQNGFIPPVAFWSLASLVFCSKYGYNSDKVFNQLFSFVPSTVTFCSKYGHTYTDIVHAPIISSKRRWNVSTKCDKWTRACLRLTGTPTIKKFKHNFKHIVTLLV